MILSPLVFYELKVEVKQQFYAGLCVSVKKLLQFVFALPN